MQHNKVTGKNGKSFFHVMSAGIAGEKIPAAFLLAAVSELGEDGVILWIGGGCKGFTPEMTANLLPYFQTALGGKLKNAVILSGSTRGDQVMVTDVAEAIRAVNPDVNITLLGTAPRTGKMHLVNGAQGGVDFRLDEWNATNNAYDHQLIVQPDADSEGDWDYDVKTRLQAVKTMQSAGYEVVGCFINGGAITADEISLSVEQGWNTILVTGTGRAADDAAVQLQGNQKVFVADYDDPNTLTAAARKAGLLRNTGGARR